MKQICPTCSGTGRVEIYRPPFLRPCRNCKGTGHVPEQPPVKGVGPTEKSRSAPAQEKKNG
jgi:DnaJ-class molecular chaperone